LLYANELESYEQRLVDEWEHSFAAMEDELAECSGITVDEKIKEGRRLYEQLAQGFYCWQYSLPAIFSLKMQRASPDLKIYGIICL